MMKSFKRQIVSLLILMAFALAFVPVTTMAAVIFPDVPETHWAAPAIDRAVSAEIIEGFPDGEFKPDNTFTRAELATVIQRAFNLDVSEIHTESFSDVDREFWAYHAIEAVKGYMSEYSAITSERPSFRPNAEATREEIMVVATNILRINPMMQSSADRLLSQFADGDKVSYQLRPHVAEMIARNVIRGIPLGDDFYIMAEKGVTRAEAAVILDRVGVGNVWVRNISYPKPVSSETFVLTGEVPSGARVWVDDAEAAVDSEGNFTSENIRSNIVEKGSHIMSVKVRAELGSVKIEHIIDNIAVDSKAPVIYYLKYSPTASGNIAMISGRVSSEAAGLRAFLDDSPIQLNANGEFTAQAQLKNGINSFLFSAVNELGNEANQSISIYLPIVDLAIKLDQSGLVNVSNESYTFSGSIATSEMKGLKLMVSRPADGYNSEIPIGMTFMFSHQVTLKPGENRFIFSAANESGGKHTLEVTIVYEALPIIEVITQIPEFIEAVQGNERITVTGRLINVNEFYVNGKIGTFGADGSFSFVWVFDNFGENRIRLEAISKTGHRAAPVVLVTTYDVIEETGTEPRIMLGSYPSIVDQPFVTISGTVTNNPNSFSINGENVNLGQGRTFSKTVSLAEGLNTIELIAENTAGVGRQTIYVTYTPGNDAGTNPPTQAPGASTLSMNKVTVEVAEEITFSWTPASGATSYEMQMQSPGSPWTSGYELPSNQYQVRYPAPGYVGTYYYTIYSVNQLGKTEGNTITVTVNAATVPSSTGGQAGQNVTWSFNGSTGVLEISGSGPMYGWWGEGGSNNGYSSPWYAYRDSIKTLIVNPGVTLITNSAFAECINLTSVSLPEGLRTIQQFAFSGCTALTSIHIPSTVNYFVSPFTNCSSLVNCNIPYGVTELGYGAFMGCSSLRNITIPASVRQIGMSSFDGTYSLQTVTFEGNAPTLDTPEGVIGGLHSGVIIYYPSAASGWNSPDWTNSGLTMIAK